MLLLLMKERLVGGWSEDKNIKSGMECLRDLQDHVSGVLIIIS